MTLLGAVSAGTSRAELWGLTAPGSGVLTISATQVGTNSATWAIAATSYTGHRTSGGSPFGTVVAGSATGTVTNFSVSSTVADLVAFGFGISAVNATITLGNGVKRADVTHSTTGRFVVGDIYGAPTVSLSASSSVTGVWGMLGVPIVATAITASVVKFDNLASQGLTTFTSVHSVVVTATSNAVLLVFIHNVSVTTSAVNVGASALTLLQGLDYYAEVTPMRRVEIWGLTAPASGNLTISANAVGGVQVEGTIAGMTFTGARTTGNPFGGTVTKSTSVTATTSLIISSTANNRVAMVFASDGNEFVVPENGVTDRNNVAAPRGWIIADAPGATNVTASATAGVSVWGSIGINIIASATFVSAIAAMTDGAGTFSASANIRVTGSIVKTDTADTFSASSGVRVRGPLAATEAADTFSASGGARVRGSLVKTDAPDTFATSANIRVTGSFIKTDAQDAFAASANIRVVGSLTKTDTVDAFLGTAGVRVTGTLAASDITDTFTAVGITTNNRTGSLAATDAPDIFSASGVARVTTRLSATDVGDTFSLSGAVRVTTLLAATDTRDSFSASANPIPAFLTAALSATDAPDTFLATTPITVLPSANLSYGGSGGKKGKSKPPYIQLDSDWWDARERYLLSLQPDMVEPQIESAPETTITPDVSPANASPQFLIDYRAERRAVIQAIPLAENMKVLRVAGERLRTINQKIIEQERAQAAELSFKRAEAALVQADTAERRALRQQQIKRKRIAIATLEVARQVVRLYGNHHL